MKTRRKPKAAWTRAACWAACYAPMCSVQIPPPRPQTLRPSPARLRSRQRLHGAHEAGVIGLDLHEFEFVMMTTLKLWIQKMIL